MPKSLHVLALLTLQAATVAGALTVLSAPHPTARPSGPSVAVTSSIRPVSVALRRPAPQPAPRRSAGPHVRTARRVVQAPRPVPARRTARPMAATSRPVPHLSLQQQVDLAAARIRGYRPGTVTWILQSNDGYWGTADWYAHAIWISPTVPTNRVFDVVVHEWSHLQSVVVYGGDVTQAVSEMNRYFGGTDLVGAERAADCMARLQGAAWTHYTPCTDTHWRAGAARLLAGERL